MFKDFGQKFTMGLFFTILALVIITPFVVAIAVAPIIGISLLTFVVVFVMITYIAGSVMFRLGFRHSEGEGIKRETEECDDY